MAFTWNSNTIGLNKCHLLMKIKGFLPLYISWGDDSSFRYCLDCDITRFVQKVNSPWPDTERQRLTDRQCVRFIKGRDLRMCHPQTGTEWRLGIFFMSLKTFCVCDAILTLCDDVTIVFSQISRKKDESETQKQAFMPAVIGCCLKINQQTFQQSIHHKV